VLSGVSRDFPESLHDNVRTESRLRRDCFLTNTYQFIIHKPYESMM